MIRQNLHTHTVYDDGANTPMEMAIAAAGAGLTSLGFSGHSVLPYENDWAMTERSREEWLAKVRETKSAMSGRLEVYEGLEWDLLSAPPEGCDYVIGSIHHLGPAAPRLTVDESPEVTLRAIDEVLPQFDAKTPEALFQAIHLGKHSVKQVANRIQAVLEAPSPEELAERARQEAKRREQEKLDGQHLRVPQNRNKSQGRSKRSSCGVVVKGDPDLLVHLAHCCNPVAGDDILGFITRGRGVSVHRASCPNVRALMENPERLIEVEWDASGASEFQVEMVVEASDRMGLLKDITIAITDAGANILSASTQTTREGVARLRFLVAISDASLLDTLFASISRVPSVFDCRRLMPGEGQNQMKRFV